MRSTTVLVVACALAAAPRALADPKADAQAHIDAAAQAHKAGKYKQALEELATAYTLDPRPELLYAIGQLHVKLDQCDQAITFYERFLATKPDAGPAGAATEAVATCKQRLAHPSATPPVDAQARAQAPPPPAHQPPPPEQPPRPRSNAFFHDAIGDAMALGAIALGLVAALEYQSALHDLDLASGASSYHDFSAYASDASSKRLIAVVGGLGGCALAVGAVLHYRSFRRTRTEPHLSVLPTTRGAAVALSFGF